MPFQACEKAIEQYIQDEFLQSESKPKSIFDYLDQQIINDLYVEYASSIKESLENWLAILNKKYPEAPLNIGKEKHFVEKLITLLSDSASLENLTILNFFFKLHLSIILLKLVRKQYKLPKNTDLKKYLLQYLVDFFHKLHRALRQPLFNNHFDWRFSGTSSYNDSVISHALKYAPDASIKNRLAYKAHSFFSNNKNAEKNHSYLKELLNNFLKANDEQILFPLDSFLLAFNVTLRFHEQLRIIDPDSINNFNLAIIMQLLEASLNTLVISEFKTHRWGLGKSLAAEKLRESLPIKNEAFTRSVADLYVYLNIEMYVDLGLSNPSNKFNIELTINLSEPESFVEKANSHHTNAMSNPLSKEVIVSEPGFSMRPVMNEIIDSMEPSLRDNTSFANLISTNIKTRDGDYFISDLPATQNNGRLGYIYIREYGSRRKNYLKQEDRDSCWFIKDGTEQSVPIENPLRDASTSHSTDEAIPATSTTVLMNLNFTKPTPLPKPGSIPPLPDNHINNLLSDLHKERANHLYITPEEQIKASEFYLQQLDWQLRENQLEQEQVKQEQALFAQPLWKTVAEDKEKYFALAKKMRILEQQHAILWAKHTKEQEKLAVIKELKADPQLCLFFNTIRIKLEEFFIGSKAVASRLIAPKLSTTSSLVRSSDAVLGKIATEVIKLCGESFLFIPGAGLVSGIVSLYTAIDKKRQVVKSKHVSSIASLSDLELLADYIAIELTLRYRRQITQLKIPKAELEENSTFLKGKFNQANKAVFLETTTCSIQQVAEFAVARIITYIQKHGLSNLQQNEFDESTFVKQLLTELRSPISGTISSTLNALLPTLGLRTITTQSGNIWSYLDMYLRPGIEIEKGELYIDMREATRSDTGTYGYCFGYKDETDGLTIAGTNRARPAFSTFRPDNTLLASSLFKPTKAITGVTREMGSLLQRIGRLETQLPEREDQDIRRANIPT